MARTTKASGTAKANTKPEGPAKAAGDDLLDLLAARFAAHPHRHPGVRWQGVAARLDARALASLAAMEASGGEPDVVLLAAEMVFVDCAPESPAGRRSLCYDRDARLARKEAAPKNSALELAAAMGVEILTEAEYRALQALEAFDQKTSSWIATPAEIRALEGAIFCDRRFGRVFTYHNGVQSYYAARGFRAKLRL